MYSLLTKAVVAIVLSSSVMVGRGGDDHQNTEQAEGYDGLAGSKFSSESEMESELEQEHHFHEEEDYEIEEVDEEDELDLRV